MANLEGRLRDRRQLAAWSLMTRKTGLLQKWGAAGTRSFMNGKKG